MEAMIWQTKSVLDKWIKTIPNWVNKLQYYQGCVHPKWYMQQRITVPTKMSKRALRSFVKLQMAKLYNMPLSELQYDVLFLFDEHKQYINEILVFAVKKSRLKKINETSKLQHICFTHVSIFWVKLLHKIINISGQIYKSPVMYLSSIDQYFVFFAINKKKMIYFDTQSEKFSAHWLMQNINMVSKKSLKAGSELIVNKSILSMVKEFDLEVDVSLMHKKLEAFVSLF